MEDIRRMEDETQRELETVSLPSQMRAAPVARRSGGAGERGL
jgi:hypothetical protein